MTSKKIKVEAARLMHYAFSDIFYSSDSSYLVYRYVTSQFKDRQLILNNLIRNRVAVVKIKNKVTIISLH